MKSVLASIQPHWCEKIASGEKTLEVRKTRPKLETPFKVYIYCTTVKSMNLQDYCALHAKTGGAVDDWHGKVIGEFVCDHIYQFSTGNIEGQDILREEMEQQSCLTFTELDAYENNAEPKEGCVYLVGIYAWHISYLKIYDKPRELSEFYFPPEKYCKKELCGGCPHDQMMGLDGDYGYDCEWERPLSRAPQSWCYVEGSQ